jgi:hypothetical protein
VIVSYVSGRLRVPFLCLSKEKRRKERTPDDLALRASLRFSDPAGVLRRDILVPRRTRRIPAAPLRAIPTGSCDARRRQRDWKTPRLSSMLSHAIAGRIPILKNPTEIESGSPFPFCCAEHRSPLRLRPEGADATRLAERPVRESAAVPGIDNADCRVLAPVSAKASLPRAGRHRDAAGQGWPVERPPQRMRSAGHPKGAPVG